jgi:hypothetical protein
MNMLQWLQSLRRADPTTAADIRRQLDTLRRRHDQMIAERDALALDAVNNDTAAERWQRLDAARVEIARRMQVLTAALPRAEEREAEAARQAELAGRAAQMQEFERQTEADRAWADAVVAALPDGPLLTEARNRRDRLRADAASLSRWSSAAVVRRPFDSLAFIYDALAHRVARIERARWIHGRHAITLGTAGQHEAIAEATERVATLGGTQP